MDELALTFLPYPHVYDGSRREGMTHSWPARCERCNRQCEHGPVGSVEICSYGVNYVRVDEALTVAGVIVKDYASQSKAHKKMLRVAGKEAIRESELQQVLLQAGRADSALAQEVASAKEAVIREYRESAGYKQDLVTLLRPSLEQTFAQVHDYRQLITQIVQNINVVLETDFPGRSLDEQLDLAATEVRSIYWAARLMEFKLESALFLVYPQHITDHTRKVYFRLHGAVLKYVRIYRPIMDRRSIKLRMIGESFGKLNANPDAIGVIPHAFLDNAIKYAPNGSEILVEFTESDETIDLRVTSLGPKIAPADHERIFEIFYRGDGAKRSGQDGTGFGLGLAQHIATEVGAVLEYSQERQPHTGQTYVTSFVARFPRPIASERPPAIVNARDRRRGGRTRG